MLEDLGLFFGTFPVGVAGPCRDPGDEDVSWCAQENDVVEVRVERSLVGLAAGDEQVAVIVAGQQAGDGVLAPYPVRGAVWQK